jgi:hypothetical protein
MQCPPRTAVNETPAEDHLGEMRASGVRGLLVYCADYKCSHWTKISGDGRPDDVRLSDLEPMFVCQACGQRGADVRPLFRRLATVNPRPKIRGTPDIGGEAPADRDGVIRFQHRRKISSILICNTLVPIAIRTASGSCLVIEASKSPNPELL